MHQEGTAKQGVSFHNRLFSNSWLKEHFMEPATHVAEGMPLPVRGVLKFMWRLRRPSLATYLPSALIHFIVVESLGSFIVAMCWFSIFLHRLSDLWLSSRKLNPLMDCSYHFAYAALSNPLRPDAAYECEAVGISDDAEASEWLLPYSEICEPGAEFEAPAPLSSYEMTIAFYSPLLLLVMFKLYRFALFMRYCGAGFEKPLSFASGKYLAFCWRLARSRTHKVMLGTTVAIFLASTIFVLVHGGVTGIDVKSGNAFMTALHILVMLNKLEEMGRGEVPEHKFEDQAFFEQTTFLRTWLDLFTQSSSRYANQLMEALWRYKAGDTRLLNQMLEKGPNVRNGTMKFFGQCEGAQLRESRERDRRDGFEADDEQIDQAAEIMFGDSLNPDSPQEVKEALAQALAIKAETDARIALVKRRFSDDIQRAAETVAKAVAEKDEALSLAAKTERELNGLRALREKLHMREMECGRLRAEAAHLGTKDSLINAIKEENETLKESVVSLAEEKGRFQNMVRSGSFLKSSIQRTGTAGSVGLETGTESVRGGPTSSSRLGASLSAPTMPRLVLPRPVATTDFAEMSPADPGKASPQSALQPSPLSLPPTAGARDPAGHLLPPNPPSSVSELGSSLTTATTLPARPGPVEQQLQGGSAMQGLADRPCDDGFS